MSESIGDIVARVAAELEGRNRDQASRVCGEIIRLSQQQERWSKKLADRRLNNRRPASLTINGSSVGDDFLDLAVNVHGVRCASMRVDGNGLRHLKWHATRTYGWSTVGPTDWGRREVGRELASRAKDVAKNPRNKELWVQLKLVDQLVGGLRTDHPALRGFRPALYCDRFPIQFSLPVAPRRHSAVSGDPEKALRDGHLDLLVRRTNRKTLSIFELKRPTASRSEVEGALSQAVEYGAALGHLMESREVRAAMWSLAGSRQTSTRPRFEAVAVVSEGNEALLRGAAASLGRHPDFDLSGLLYARPMSIGGDLNLRPIDLFPQ